MYTISKGAIPAIAGDFKNLVSATNNAVAMHGQIIQSTMEAANASNLPLNATQQALDEIIASLHHFMEGRAAICKTVAKYTVIGRSTNQAEQMDGCPDGFPGKTTSVEPVAVAA